MSALIHFLSAWGTGVAVPFDRSSSPVNDGAANAGEGAHLIAPSHRDPFCVGRAAVARRSHKPEVLGSIPSPATIILLKALAAHDGVSVAQLVERLACERARALGLSRLARAVADHNFAHGQQPCTGAAETSAGVQSDARLAAISEAGASP